MPKWVIRKWYQPSTFQGDYEEWIGFYDTVGAVFKTLTELDDIRPFAENVEDNEMNHPETLKPLESKYHNC